MAKQLVSDELWAVVEPLLPKGPPKPRGGRPRVPDRAALTGIIFVLRTGIPWEYLPKEMGCGSGMTCWRRLRDWNKAEVWHRLHTVLLDRLGQADRIDWGRASLDSTSLRAKKGAETGPSPTDRGKAGSKHHVLVDRGGIPLSAWHGPANEHDSRLFEAVLELVEPIKRPRGRPRSRPAKLHADKAYDIPRAHAYLKHRGILDRIARKGVESSAKLGRYRWVAERAQPHYP